MNMLLRDIYNDNLHVPNQIFPVITPENFHLLEGIHVITPASSHEKRRLLFSDYYACSINIVPCHILI
jgi:hypothetical protein